MKFNLVALESKNGKIYVEDVTSEEFVSVTKNAVIDLTGTNSSRIAAIPGTPRSSQITSSAAMSTSAPKTPRSRSRTPGSQAYGGHEQR